MTNPLQLIVLGLFVVVIIGFMVRNGRKRSRDQASLASSLRPGAEIMTTGGLYGTVESVDEDANKVVLRTGPTSEITIHRQAIGRVITPAPDETVPPVDATPTLNGEPIDDPAYGERVDPVATGDDAAARGTKRDAR